MLITIKRCIQNKYIHQKNKQKSFRYFKSSHIQKNQIILKQSEIESLQKQIVALKLSVEKEKEENKQLQKKLQQIRIEEQQQSFQSLQDLQQKLDFQKSQILKLQEEQESKKTQLSLHNSLESQIKQELSLQQVQLKERLVELDRKNEEVLRLNQIISGYLPYDGIIKKVKELKDINILDIEVIDNFELGALKKQLESFSTSNELLNRSLKEKEQDCSTLNQLQRQLESLKDELHQKNQTIQQFTGTVGQVSAQANSLEEKNRQFQQIILSLKQDNQDLKNKSEKSEQVAEQLKSQVKQQKDQNSNLEQLIDSLQKKLKKFEVEHQQTYNALDEKENEVFQLKLRLQTQIESTEQLNNQLRLQLEQSKQQEQLNKCDKQKYEELLKQYQIQSETDQLTIKGLQQECSELSNEISTLQGSLDQQMSDIKQQSESNGSNLSEIQQLRAKVLIIKINLSEITIRRSHKNNQRGLQRFLLVIKITYQERKMLFCN